MTTDERNALTDLNTDSIDKCAISWLERKCFGPWTEADQAELETWLAISWAHRTAYWRLETGWARTERLTALRKPNAPNVAPAKSKTWFLRLGSAGVLLGVAIFGLWAYAQISGSHDLRYTTGIGERKVLRLADGSRIELNTGTTLRISSASDRRLVWLDQGEAYFDIKHDAKRPFTVISLNRRITDLGTKFSVRNEADRLKVSLVEGLARIEAVGTVKFATSAVLSPGDVVLATANSLQIVRNSEQVLRDQLGWRRGMLVFVHATLADAAAEFNRYNRTKIVIADRGVAQRRIGGTFPAQDIEDFAVLARTSLRLRVEERDGSIIISR